MIKVISAILSGQTLHYAGHWWVAQTRPCKRLRYATAAWPKGKRQANACAPALKGQQRHVSINTGWCNVFFGTLQCKQKWRALLNKSTFMTMRLNYRYISQMKEATLMLPYLVNIMGTRKILYILHQGMHARTPLPYVLQNLPSFLHNRDQRKVKSYRGWRVQLSWRYCQISQDTAC